MMTKTSYSSSDLVFRLVDGTQQGTLFPISTQKCLLGKSCDESGQENGHCAIVRGPNGASIKSFGTEVIVNGQPVESQWLNEGDEIEIGAAKLEVIQLGRYVTPESETAGATSPEPVAASESPSPSQSPASEPVSHEPVMAQPVPSREEFAVESRAYEPAPAQVAEQFRELTSSMDQMSADASSLSMMEESAASTTVHSCPFSDPVDPLNEPDSWQTEETKVADVFSQEESIYSPLNAPEPFDQPEPIQETGLYEESPATVEQVVESEALDQELKFEKAFASIDHATMPAQTQPSEVEVPNQSTNAAESRLREVFMQHLHEQADQIVYDAEEDKTVDSEPVENETVAQLLARMQKKGQLHGYKADEDEIDDRHDSLVEERPSQVEPTHLVPSSRETNSHNSNDDEDASVQDYMNRLLGRMGPAVASAANAPAAKVVEETPQFSVPTNDRESVELLTPSEYKPSKRPPEANKNLDAMRELANQSNRVAIEKSQTRRAKAYALTNFGLMTLGLALGAYLVSNANGTTDSMMWTGGAVLGISLFLGGAGVKALISKKVTES